VKNENTSTRRVLVRSSVPVFASAAAWVLYALFFPLYRIPDIIIAAAVSALVYIVVRIFVPFRFYLNPVKEVPILDETGDGTADALLLALQGYSAFLQEKAAAQHPLSARLSVLCELTERMRAQILANPEQARQLRKTVDYYLPTVQKLVTAHGETGADVDERIAHVLDSVADAFRKQLAQLHENRVLDVETDIAVLRQVLAREGFSAQGSVHPAMGADGRKAGEPDEI